MLDSSQEDSQGYEGVGAVESTNGGITNGAAKNGIAKNGASSLVIRDTLPDNLHANGYVDSGFNEADEFEDVEEPEHGHDYDDLGDLTQPQDVRPPTPPSHREFVLRPSPKRRPRRNFVQHLVGSIAGGVGGLLLAAYALIWLRGPQLDVFRMRTWMPPILLPGSMQAVEETAANQPSDRQSAANQGNGSTTRRDEGGLEREDRADERDDDESADDDLLAIDRSESTGDSSDDAISIVDDSDDGSGLLPPDMNEPSVADAAISEAARAAPGEAAPAANVITLPQIDAAPPETVVEQDSAVTPSSSTAAIDAQPEEAAVTPIAEAPAAPSATDDAAVTQATATTPTREEPPQDSLFPPEAPTTPWPATPVVGDLAAPEFFSLVELRATVLAAANAGSEFNASNLATAPSPKPMGHAYVKLCAVAEQLTLTDPAAYGLELTAVQDLARLPFNRVAANSDRRDDLAEIAARWWKYPKRQNSGVFFVGRVREVHMQGRWTECVMEVASAKNPVTIPVLMDGVRVSTGSEAAVVGVIVEQPQQRITGYQGDAAMTVVAGYIFDPAKVSDSEAAGSPGNLNTLE